jgi:peroxiredoxin
MCLLVIELLQKNKKMNAAIKINAYNKILPVFLLIFFSLNLFSQTSENLRETDKVKVGDTCPKFKIKDIENASGISNSMLKGNITLINFFATWCGPCMKELPEVQKQIWEKYKDNKKFKLIVIGRGHSDKTLKEFKIKKGFTFPMYADSNKVVYEKFAGKYIPRNFIVDKNGKIVYSGIDYNEQEFAEILKKLDELLK